MRKILIIAISITLSSVMAEDITTLKGETFKKATVTRVEPDGITLTHATGVAKIPFSDLPKEWQEKYGYDPQKAAAYAAQDAEIQRLIIEYREKALEEAKRQKLENYKRLEADLDQAAKRRRSASSSQAYSSQGHRPVTDADLRAAGVSQEVIGHLHREEADLARYHGGGSVVYRVGDDGAIYRNGIPIP